jgi:hypothetical protein
MMKTYDRIAADSWLRVLELLLDTRDDRLTVGADEGSEDKFRVNGMSSNDLTGDADQCSDPDGRQVADLELGVDLVEGDVVFLQKQGM